MEEDVISILDCKDIVLRNSVWKSSRDYSLFHTSPARIITNKSIFDDSSFFDIFLNHKTDWGAPLPTTFQSFFKDILELLIPKQYTLILSIEDLYDDYFQPHVFEESFLKPNNLAYFYLAKEINGREFSALFFECPIEKVTILDEVAFSATSIHVEGFVLERSRIDLFHVWQTMGNTDFMFRDLLRNVYFAFAIWADYNGLFIATDKFDIEETQRIFSGSNLENDIVTYIHQESKEQ